eukprot:jgi/Mesvir1/21424/Mv20896-RA.1
METHADPRAKERRDLLQFIVETYHGMGRISLPPQAKSVADIDYSLLAVGTEQLISILRAGQTLDLSNTPLVRVSLDAAARGDTFPHSGPDAGTLQSSTPEVRLGSLYGPLPALDDPELYNSGSEGDQPVVSADLSPYASTLDESHGTALQSTAYAVLCWCTAEELGSEDALAIMQEQLGLQPGEASAIRGVVDKMMGSGHVSASMQLPLHLLLSLRPSHFPSHKHFTRWVLGQCRVLSEGLHLALTEPSSGQEGQNSAQEPNEGQAGVKDVLGKLDGLVRDVEALTTATQWEEPRYLRAMATLRAYVTDISEAGSPDVGLAPTGWHFRYPLSMQLYETLLRSIFDVLEEEEGKLIEEVPTVLEALSTTWGALHVTKVTHALTHAWVLFRQYQATRELGLGLLTASCEMLKLETWELWQRMCVYHDPARGASTSDEEKADMAAMLRWGRAVLAPMRRWAAHQLANYHATFPRDPRDVRFRCITSLLHQAARMLSCCQGGEFSRSEQWARADVASVVKSSITRALAASRADLKAMEGSSVGSATTHALTHLAGRARDVLRIEETFYLPALTAVLPEARDVAVLAAHDALRVDVDAYLDSAPPITPWTLAAMADVKKLESELLRSISPRAPTGSHHGASKAAGSQSRGSGGGASSSKNSGAPAPTVVGLLPLDVAENDPLAPLVAFRSYSVEERILPQFYLWVNEKVLSLREWVKRAVMSEDWKPLSTQHRHAPSVIEVLQLSNEALDMFFDAGMALPVSLLRALTEGIDGALQLYCEQTIQSLGDFEALAPPLPKLTRYKKDLAEKIEIKTLEKESRKLERASRTGSPLVEEVSMEEMMERGRIAALTPQVLSTRLNSLDFLLRNLGSLEELIVHRYKATHEDSEDDEESNGARPGIDVSSWLTGLFDGTRQVCVASVSNLCMFIGLKIVFFDLRGPFLEDLYRRSVAENRLAAVQGRLDTLLGELCELVEPSLANQVAEGLLYASIEGWLRVLLDGGPLRLFTPADVEMLEEDLEVLKDMFLADGQGLHARKVDELMTRAHCFLSLFQLDTDILIANFKAAEKKGSGNGEMMGGGGRSKWKMSSHLGLMLGREYHAPPQGAAIVSGAESITSSEVLLRVLCHRADRMASKFLKFRFKIAKQ